MHKITFLLALCFIWDSSVTAAPFRFTAANSTEAKMVYRGEVRFTSTPEAFESHAQHWAENQTLYLFGSMAAAPLRGAPKMSHTVTVLDKEKIGENYYRAIYQYESVVMVTLGNTQGFTVRLPLDPAKIWDQSAVHTGGQTSYPCTDPHYLSAGWFWYFWNVGNPGCPLKPSAHYIDVKATLTRFPNTRQTFPEYARLVDPVTKTISLHVILGMENAGKPRNPYKSDDYNATNYRSIRNTLVQRGYASKTWTDAEVQAVAGNTPNQPFVEEFRKQTWEGTLLVRLIFTPSGYGYVGYRKFLIQGLTEGSIVSYNGHSGFGSNLDLGILSQVEGVPIAPNANRYQIMYINGCSSYPYYVQGYFNSKKTASDPNGTKNLDIISNGLMTSFGVMGNNVLNVLGAVEWWANHQGNASYQWLSQVLDSQNLLAISGDEDNAGL